MSLEVIAIWLVYILLFFFLVRLGKNSDKTLSGSVGFVVQSLAYVATYISAVALIGFGGLAYKYGLQMMLVALGNVVLGTWLVYKLFAWRTRKVQTRLGARTPAQLLSLGHKTPSLRVFLGFIFAIFLSVYASAVIKGAAFMLQGVVNIPLEAAVVAIAGLIGFAVWWGGLRGVLFTEAMQGAVMLVGICILGYSVLSRVGGFVGGYEALAALPPTELANNGFTSLSSGSQAYFIISLVVVTSIAVWAQPQMIQRHFAIATPREIKKSIWLATISILILLGGMYYISALSVLILPEIAVSDRVVPTLVNLYLPEIGQHLFVLAIVSASLSTCTGLFHIAASSLTEDIGLKKRWKQSWTWAIIFCVCISAGTALLKGQLIAIIHTTSWSVIGASALVPYLTLIFLRHEGGRAALASSLAGFASCLAFYLIFTPHTSVLPESVVVPAILRQFPPFLVGLTFSALTYFGVLALQKTSNTNFKSVATIN